MADIVDVASVVNCATGMQLKKAFEAIVKADPSIKINTKDIKNAGAPFRGRATGLQLHDAFAAINAIHPGTVDLSTIQNRMDGSQLKDAFTAVNIALASGAAKPAPAPPPVVKPVPVIPASGTTS